MQGGVNSTNSKYHNTCNYWELCQLHHLAEGENGGGCLSHTFFPGSHTKLHDGAALVNQKRGN